MEGLIVVIFFVYGTILGSFYNVVGLRVPLGNFLQSERSYCPVCNKVLRWYELIPVFSYAIQLGKCRRCKQSIKQLYPIMELLTGVLFALSYITFGFDFALIPALLIVSLSVIIIITDLIYMLIPNKILLIFFPLAIIGHVIQPPELWWSPLLGGIVGFLIIFVIIIVTKGGMGAGDMKYLAVLGLFLGFPLTLLTFFLATVYGASVNGILLYFKKIDRKKPVPFGPYISFAALTSLFYGDIIINWYFTTFF